MDRRPMTFHDGYWYCYANSVAMLLSSVGEDIPPRLVEVLSGVGLGAFVATDGSIAGGLPFFSGLAGLPDAGITRALAMLGFGFEERATDGPGPAPFAELAAVLAESPAILGPLDMCLLSYNPGRPASAGVDHFVVADRIEAGRVVVYDTAGFAEATISKAELEPAWRADAIAYKRGRYRYWTRPRRLTRPTGDQIAAAAVASFKRLYDEADRLACETGCLADGAAIDHMAGLVRRAALTPAQSSHLLHFALPLGAKRALDFAAFFEARSRELAALKRRQARLFGECQSSLARDDTQPAADRLSRLAELETSLRDEIERL